MTDFEEVLAQYEPMIFAAIRQLNIYRNQESFRQAGRVALWQAWSRYKEGKGHFAPYASRSIRGAMLDLLKKESLFEENEMQAEADFLTRLVEKKSMLNPFEAWSERLKEAFENLTENEKELIHWIFVKGLTQAECAAKVGISVSGIKKRRERILKKLRGMLD